MLCTRAAFLVLLLLTLGWASEVDYHLIPKPFDIKIANESVYLATDVLCDSKTFSTRNYWGAAEGFKYYATIRDEKTDTTGFVGVLNSKIYVTYRGTSSKTQWADDAEGWQDNPGWADCKECQIHHGFHKCMDATFEQAATAVSALRKEFPNYPVITSGHSLGGALSNLAAILLIQKGIQNVLHYSFGSPRVGNDAYATYSDKLLPHAQRITHFKDMVPHTPPAYVPLVATYEHIVTEVYEDERHVLHPCKGPSDPTCSSQWSTFETNPADHSLYLDVVTSCPDSSP